MQSSGSTGDLYSRSGGSDGSGGSDRGSVRIPNQSYDDDK